VPSSTRILVLRHGQSEWNALGRWQGQADPPLTDAGREQAYRATQLLGQFDLIATSDLQRAHETAAIISQGLGIGPVIVDARLRETHVGEWEGLTHDDIEREYPGYLAAHKRPPSFESEASLIERFTAAITDIAIQCQGGEALCVAHAGVIRVMRRAMGVADPRIPNLGGCHFIISPGSGRNTLVVGDVVDLIEHGPIGEEL
jgi:broad specificity phosphatase PhoE